MDDGGDMSHVISSRKHSDPKDYHASVPSMACMVMVVVMHRDELVLRLLAHYQTHYDIAVQRYNNSSQQSRSRDVMMNKMASEAKNAFYHYSLSLIFSSLMLLVIAVAYAYANYMGAHISIDLESVRRGIIENDVGDDDDDDDDIMYQEVSYGYCAMVVLICMMICAWSYGVWGLQRLHAAVTKSSGQTAGKLSSISALGVMSIMIMTILRIEPTGLQSIIAVVSKVMMLMMIVFQLIFIFACLTASTRLLRMIPTSAILLALLMALHFSMFHSTSTLVLYDIDVVRYAVFVVLMFGYFIAGYDMLWLSRFIQPTNGSKSGIHVE